MTMGDVNGEQRIRCEHPELQQRVDLHEAALVGQEQSRDITAWKHAEEALREQVRRYDELFENMLDGFMLLEVICDLDGNPVDHRLIRANFGFERMTGLSRSEELGRTSSTLSFKLAPEVAQEYYRIAFGSEPLHTERFNPSLQRHYDVRVFSPRRGQCAVIFHDITERKRAEVEKIRLEAQLQQAAKMESVGRLAGGVAHDFNNMLGVILGHAESALGQVDPALPIHSSLEEILKAAQRSADLTRQLLAFGRKQTILPKVLNLNTTVDNMLDMLRRLIGEAIELVWQPAVELWTVRVDPSQIDQIMANLCVNARDAIDGTGKIIVKTGNVTLDDVFCTDHAGAVPGDYVQLVVSDDGNGMDEATLTHIFEPFFTTKEMGKGTGLGLATVYGVVTQNDGFINVMSEPDHGTTINIYLPRYVGISEQVPANDVKIQAVRCDETILLVEDEPALLALVMKLLTRQGYTVLAAGSPDEAIRLAGGHAGKIHLLVSDVVMPQMNGLALAEELLFVNPRLKLLFMSGYSADLIAHEGVRGKGLHFIEKPYLVQDLLSKVRQVLGEP